MLFEEEKRRRALGKNFEFIEVDVEEALRHPSIFDSAIREMTLSKPSPLPVLQEKIRLPKYNESERISAEELERIKKETRALYKGRNESAIVRAIEEVNAAIKDYSALFPAGTLPKEEIKQRAFLLIVHNTLMYQLEPEVQQELRNRLGRLLSWR